MSADPGRLARAGSREKPLPGPADPENALGPAGHDEPAPPATLDKRGTSPQSSGRGGEQGRLPRAALVAVFGSCASALYVPVWEGAHDPAAFAVLLGAVGIGLAFSAGRSRGPSPFSAYARLGLLLAGLLGLLFFGPSSAEFFPENRPLASIPMLLLLWMLVLSAAFVFLPEGPLVAFALSGTVLFVSCILDYGGVGLALPGIFLFFVVLYGFVEVRPEIETEEGPFDWCASVMELSAAVTAVFGGIAFAFYLGLPMILPKTEMASFLRDLGTREPKRLPKPKPKTPSKMPGEKQPQLRGQQQRQQGGRTDGRRQPNPTQAFQAWAQAQKLPRKPSPQKPPPQPAARPANDPTGASWIRELTAPSKTTTSSTLTSTGPAQTTTPALNRSDARLGDLRQKLSEGAKKGAQVAGHYWKLLAIAMLLAAAYRVIGRERLIRWVRRVARLLGRSPPDFLDDDQARTFLDRLAAHGMVREPWETLLEFLARLRRESRAPRCLPALIDLAVRVRYAAVPPGRAERARALALLADLDAELASRK